MLKAIIISVLLCMPVWAQNQTLMNYKSPYLISKQEMVGYQPYMKVLDQKQLKCLTDNVYFEAGNEVNEAKIAVALVTLNRLNHEYFPDTICEVVYQRTRWKCQFTWVCSGHRKIYYWKTYYESKKIAEYVIMNYELINDNTKGATFFHHRRIPNPFSRIGVEKTISIGKHVFYKL
jgi:spore germination cell wall hydrolase CwlJ-like protein